MSLALNGYDLIETELTVVLLTQPVLYATTPLYVETKKATKMTFSGENFEKALKLMCYFSTNSTESETVTVMATVKSSNVLECITPIMSGSGEGRVSVGGGGGGVTASIGFTYYERPSIIKVLFLPTIPTNLYYSLLFPTFLLRYSP